MAGRPELAVVVIGLRAPAELVAAVRSVLDQNIPLEIVIVNSGGGNAQALVDNAGLNVRVVEVEQRLFAGGARNLGIAATQAPFIAFLAGDCLACPRWAEVRLHHHRQGAATVASAILNSHPRNLVACAAHLVTYMRRLPGLPAEKALRYGVSFDRKLFDLYGLFDERMALGEDTDFMARLPEAMQPVWDPQVLTIHRNETSLFRLLADQYRRGRRLGAYLRTVEGEKPLRPFRRIFRDRRNVNKLAKEGLSGRDRTFAMLSLPIVWLALFAKSLGCAIGARYGEKGRRQ
ncbi:glycosyltransferase family A protein [Mesorhizobium sp.]|uniref:glycosyltransferase family 2 protein n=1 Tax=Mesorhizobium sp. TaxID=1871066 RepID=UPI000FD279EF|nr:glycosyltransferase family A protein [Mesorhizobium sp.]RVC52708.1 glycosyltransferase family 2 protein [Mesorhizobium sp. M4B.F.Ca.ET.088.02.2.1]RWA62665.1 MAG: glycosyltransferase family 2 protein [Mesorhizobium sp.]RWF33670.1 MAG: glycosyltransferase family 2 protein [Mesorhizobium sp.]RWF42810.1 MAG: glycosyltransferase family 2 protein [Mesorhizobium sp.]TJW04956.1 MAG: glycosyltransferase family 2 protein [Mesorhizobium sp.]